MKKYGSLIMVAVVILLAVLFWTTGDEPVEQVTTPHSIPAVENLARVEMTTPGEKGGLVVLQKSGDGWHLTKPVEAPVAERVQTALDEEFGKKINTDDIELAQDQPEEFGLTPEEAVKVSLYPKGGSSPAAEFQLGKSLSVPGTGAKRTYIRASDGKIYRAHTSLGDILVADVSKLRSKKIQQLDKSKISEITVSYKDGPTLKLVRDGKKWTLKKPEVDFNVENSQVNALVRNVSNLSAKDFVDGKKPAEVGLDPAHATISTRVGGEAHNLKISTFDEEDETYYLKTSNSPHIYVVAEETGNALTPTTLSLRQRLVHEIDKESIDRIEFGGDDRIVVQKKDGEWTFVRGAKGTLKTSALQSRLNTLAQLRAIRFEDISPTDAGLTSPDEKITFRTDEKSYTLFFGEEADKKGNLYAKWDDSDVVMVVSQWVRQRSTPSPDDLTADES